MFTHEFPFDPAYGYTLETLLRIEPPAEPEGFAAFWEETYRQARALPLNTAIRQIPSPKRGFELFEVEYDSWGGRRIFAWITVPAGRKIERGIVVGHGYGGREEVEWDLPGPAAAAIFPCARGLGRSRGADIPEDAGQHVLTGIESTETYVHRGCVADYWAAASVLLERFPEAAGRLHYAGTSFGGGIGAMTLAWDRRFAKGFLSVPSFGNHPLRVTLPCAGSGESVRLYYQEHPEVLDVLGYFDSAVHARRIRLPVMCECALFDPAVPPPGQYSVYNALNGSRHLIVSQAGHFEHAGQAVEGQRCTALQNAWFAC